MTLKAAQQLLKKSLTEMYEAREASNISYLVMQSLTGMDRSGMLVNAEVELTETQYALFDKYIHELVEYRPVQYVLGESWFAGLKFFVDENVLIPRPETEELVEWVADWIKRNYTDQKCRIIDIGTGSGCIAIALKKIFPAADVFAIDISEGALQTAKRNAATNDTLINFILLDIEDKEARSGLQNFDIVISNPPYIPLTDKSEMSPNVLKYEPHTALFVTDSDPLQFYRQIADFFSTAANQKAALFFETHEQYADDVLEILGVKGLQHLELKKDLQGKNRMIRAGIGP